MFEQAISTEMLLLMQKLSSIDEIKNHFYLAGGTALALQYGHRKSEDLDFLTQTTFDVEKLSQIILSLEGTIISEEKGTLHAKLNHIKLSFLHYPYPLLQPFKEFVGLQIASLEDIACMKAVAISQRGEKKDFYDMYEILKHIKPLHLKQLFLAKYSQNKINCYHILRSFFYFEDAENLPDPIVLDGTIWREVKAFFVKKESILTKELC
ncbi:MAG: nucleotidyl transferase AbiEii/AbiGii toxin family protein [Candidatus Parabeggiatoa sp.]|nr:nucleotidyl transferase AbiEii/AbiGii toxin family protein [Candidatus Parabeggiatoa sp.]